MFSLLSESDRSSPLSARDHLFLHPDWSCIARLSVRLGRLYCSLYHHHPPITIAIIFPVGRSLPGLSLLSPFIFTAPPTPMEEGKRKCDATNEADQQRERERLAPSSSSSSLWKARRKQTRSITSASAGMSGGRRKTRTHSDHDDRFYQVLVVKLLLCK